MRPRIHAAKIVFMLACGSCQPTASETVQPTEAAASADDLGAPSVPWEQKTREQRMEYMGLYVFPKMKAVFQAYDAESFKDFRCQTCHGDDMDDVRHRMPNALFELAKSDPMKSAQEYDEEIAKFMSEQVMPSMAELLGKQPGKELGCLNCHPGADE